MKNLLLVILLFAGVLMPVHTFGQAANNKKEMVQETNAPEISVVDNKLYVKNAPVGSYLEIITIVGNKVKSIKMKTPEGQYDLNLPKGIYIFRLEGVVRKFVVK